VNDVTATTPAPAPTSTPPTAPSTPQEAASKLGRFHRRNPGAVKEITMNSPAPAVTGESTALEFVCIKVSAAERRFIEKQSRAELRTISNYVRSLVVEKMTEE
jgi:hypothetical protein